MGAQRPERLRVLVVDDEPDVLASLERVLRPLAGRWALSFAASGEQAVYALEAGPIDALVCDIHMPGTSGAEVLRYAASRHPAVLRIALSGQPDQSVALPVINTAHSFLPKPVTAADVEAAVRQGARVLALLNDASVRDLVVGLTVLPSLPAVLKTLLEELRQPTASVSRVGELISQDAGLTAQLLRLINSPYFGLIRPVSDPALAVTLLGLETVGAVLLQHRFFELADEGLIDRVGLKGLFGHCSRTGRRAAAIGRHFGRPARECGAARAAGVLHDVGKILLAVNFPDRYHRAWRLASEGEVPLRVAETVEVGAPHDWVGGHLLALWGLPASLVEAVAFHHDPGQHAHPGGGTLGLVHLANQVEHAADHGAFRELDEDYLAAIGCPVDEQTWKDLVALEAS